MLTIISCRTLHKSFEEWTDNICPILLVKKQVQRGEVTDLRVIVEWGPEFTSLTARPVGRSWGGAGED